MNLLRNIFGKKICSNNLSELPSNLGNCFSKLKTLISNNILDISLIKEIIILIINETNESNNNEEYTASDLFIVFRKEIKRFYLQLIKEMKSEFNLSKYYKTINFTIFFYIMCLNLKNLYNISTSSTEKVETLYEYQNIPNQKNFYEIFFEKNCTFIDTLIKVVSYIKATTDSQTELFKLISNFFSEDGEIFKIFCHPKLKLTELFLKNKNIFKTCIPEMDEYNGLTLNDVTNSIYKKILKKEILYLDMNYETLFNSDKKNFCLNEDKPLIKSMLCQSILRIVFSKEKYNYLDKNFPYELIFLQNLSKKCVSYYFNNLGDDVKCLFRREELYDDLIKNIFFTFGNNFYYKCFYTSIRKLIEKYSDDNSFTEELSYLTQDEFLMFYEDLLQKLKTFLPNGIRILLKLIYDNVMTIYEGKISKDNYSPILTILFFNFFISPKLQELYNISPIKNMLIKNLNRLIRNICFNEKFKEMDDMKYFNDMIEICHLHTKTLIDKLINSFVVDDMDYMLKSEMEINYKIVMFPSYLFYFDCDYIINLLECSMDDSELLNDLSNEKNLIERIMSSKRNSFVIKFDFEDLKKLKILNGKDNECDSNLNFEDDEASEKSEDIEENIEELPVSGLNQQENVGNKSEVNKSIKTSPKIISLNKSVHEDNYRESYYDISDSNRDVLNTRRYTTIHKKSLMVTPVSNIEKKPSLQNIRDNTDKTILSSYRDNMSFKETENPVVLHHKNFDINIDYFDKK